MHLFQPTLVNWRTLGAPGLAQSQLEALSVILGDLLGYATIFMLCTVTISAVTQALSRTCHLGQRTVSGDSHCVAKALNMKV